MARNIVPARLAGLMRTRRLMLIRRAIESGAYDIDPVRLAAAMIARGNRRDGASNS